MSLLRDNILLENQHLTQKRCINFYESFKKIDTLLNCLIHVLVNA